MGKIQKQFKLSICMMVKDEEENLERCFDSIKNIISRKDAELIVVDTGSNDSSVDIIKRYTDKLYFHKWSNNFSEMRNITISYAKGEWIWILDADEELVDETKFLRLLDGPEKLSNYNTIQLIARNFLRKDGSKTSVTPLVRIFRNQNTFKFTGAVHNQPNYRPPILDTDIYFNHYGYFNDDKELMEKKFTRTSTLLKQEIKKNPNNTYYQYQLAKSYIMHGDYNDALKQIDKAYKLMNQLNLNKQQVYITATYCNIALSNKMYESTIKLAKEGLKYREDFIDLYYLLGKAYLNQFDYENALNAFKKYLFLYNRDSDLLCLKDSSLEIIYMDQQSLDNVLYDLSQILIDQEKFEEAEEYFSKITNRSIQLKLAVPLFLTNKEKLSSIYLELENFEEKIRFEQLLEEKRSKLNETEKTELDSKFIKLDSSYGLFTRIRLCNDNNELKLLLSELIKVSELEKLPVFYSEAFYIAIKNNLPVMRYLYKVPGNIIKLMVNYMVENFDNSINTIKSYLESQLPIRVGDYNNNRVFYSMVSPLLIKEGEEASQEEIEKNTLFEQYISSGKNAVQTLYKIERLRLYYQSINDSEHRIFILLMLYEDALQKRTIKVALKYLKEAAKDSKHLSKFFEALITKAYIEFGDIYSEQEDFESAIEMYEEALLRTDNATLQDEILIKIDAI